MVSQKSGTENISTAYKLSDMLLLAEESGSKN
jgi:hypothetical protein